MWVLRPEKWPQKDLEGGDRVLFIVGNDKKRSVGRRTESEPEDKPVFITGDKSVSRQHAIISTDSEGKLFVTDLGSRYGTFVSSDNEDELRQLASNQQTELHHNQLIRFGALHNVWRIERLRLTTCTSACRFDVQALNLLKSMCVNVVPNWTPECTHLTMSSITLTIKVLSALVSGRPIVAPTFWSSFQESIESDLPFPSVNDHLPSILESSLNQQTADFGIDLSRKQIFSGKCFVFFSSAQMEKYKYVLENASGDSVLMNGTNISKNELCTGKYIVIQCGDEELSSVSKNIFNDVVQYMKEKKMRIIPEAEIGLSILYKSLEKFCNPHFNFLGEIFKSQENRNRTSELPQVLAGETEPMESSHGRTYESRVVNESLSNQSSLTLNQNSNRDDKTANEQKSNRKTKRLSIDVDEPTKKKTEKKITKSSSNENNDDEDMFNFKESRVSRNKERIKDNADSDLNINNSRINKAKDKFDSRLNIAEKTNKRTINVLNMNEDNLFNFVSPSSSKFNENKSNKRFLIDDYSEEHSKTKKICLEKVNEPVIKQEKNTSTESVKRNYRLENKEWVSSKKPSLLVTTKQEPAEKGLEDMLDEKMTISELKPAIVIINNSLVKKENATLVDESGSNSLNKNVINFKKFIKVQPVKPKKEVISRSMLSLLNSQPKGSYRENFMQEDEEDNCSLVDMARTRQSRRL